MRYLRPGPFADGLAHLVPEQVAEAGPLHAAYQLVMVGAQRGGRGVEVPVVSGELAEQIGAPRLRRRLAASMQASMYKRAHVRYTAMSVTRACRSVNPAQHPSMRRYSQPRAMVDRM